MPDYRKLSKEWKYVRIPKDTLSFCPGDGPPIFVLKNNVMGKLQPDYITWTLSVNADGLQKEMLEVRNNTKELKAENMRLKSSMEKLAMQGKLQSKEYKELNEQFKANNRTISENDEKLRLLESRLDNTQKSYVQLSKQAKQLRRELDNTVKSLQPEEYARLEAQSREGERVDGAVKTRSRGGERVVFQPYQDEVRGNRLLCGYRRQRGSLLHKQYLQCQGVDEGGYQTGGKRRRCQARF